MKGFFQRHRTVILLTIATLVTVAAAEIAMGRLLLGPDGRFGWWESDIWSSACSQRVADAYSFSHLEHGMMMFGFLWLIARRVPVQWRFLAALLVECAWEVAENSSFIIDRYRAATISVGYQGDSVLNSFCDALFMMLGFFIASRIPVRATVALVVFFEVACLVLVRDNLTLNVIMLLHPIESIKVWQSALHAG